MISKIINMIIFKRPNCLQRSALGRPPLGIAGTTRDSTTPSRLSNLYSDLMLITAMTTLMMLMTMMSVVMMTVIM